jgi:hypothetical protein
MNHPTEDLMPDKQSKVTDSHLHRSNETNFDSSLRRRASVAAVSGVSLLSAVFFGFLAYHLFFHTTADGWLVKIIQTHFAATIAVPLSGVSSLCVVLTLKATAGPIEFEAFGFKFHGASGPLIFWLITFLGFISAVRFLWTLC